ncbi:Protein byr4 [Escovopsis weberi]|uniref:Protein byr4 n=1 Tax=Escovopsis weberi TaxID=150374 RepID=A0A0M8MX68_ESCWE|nr:Protein byr4 [Escovopsis weberi]
MSLRSDLDSWQGEEQHVHIPGDDERSTLAAIAAAESAGIPIPKNVPSSALTGGTIKRLRGRKIRRIIQEDWENDLELPDPSLGFQMNLKKQPEFPATLRRVSGGSLPTSPGRPRKSTGGLAAAAAAARDDRRSSIVSNISVSSAALSLDRFRDAEDDDDFFDTVGPLNVIKSRQPPRPPSFVVPPTPQEKRGRDRIREPDDDFEKDLELPSDGNLKLAPRADLPRTFMSQCDELDWGEGSSLGTRYGGTGRDGRSCRSSSVSALSPSISSTFTAESEEENMDGLVLPAGPVNFQERLQHRKKKSQTDIILEELLEQSHLRDRALIEVDQKDFLDGLELGDGDVFKKGRLTYHKNIKIKETRSESPARPKTAVSLTFSNKPALPLSLPPPPQARVPRLNHERPPHTTSLEPVSESGGPIPQKFRRAQSRLSHSTQSSVASLPTPSSGAAPTPRRSDMSTRSSFPSLRNETSSTDSSSRPNSGLRPKTPIERRRSTADSPTRTKKPAVPFLPAGASQNQSHHITSKGGRPLRRRDSDNLEVRSASRSLSRGGLRSPSPFRLKPGKDKWERLSRPKNKKHFGDGHELDAFDDLPTSRESETRFLRQPLGSGGGGGGGPGTLRRISQTIHLERTQSPMTRSPKLSRLNPTPSFARDTASSRIARETSLAHRTPSGGHLAAFSGGPRIPPVTARGRPIQQAPAPQIPTRPKKSSKRAKQLKPHLISNLNSDKESRVVNGMFYNADACRWEGNENVLNAFDFTASTPSTASMPCHPAARDKETATPRPALITNFSATKGVQVVGGMVFDPHNMCWLKLGHQSGARSEAAESMDDFGGAVDDDEDVFKDIPDLEENPAEEEREGRASEVKDDWLIGEEFDVGPAFIRRHREEEERWRRKCEKWIGQGRRDHDVWRWTIRDLVSQFEELPIPQVDQN